MFRPISTSDNVVYIFVKSYILITSSLGIVVRIPDCHLGDRGSNPGPGGRIFFLFFYHYLTFFCLALRQVSQHLSQRLRNV